MNATTTMPERAAVFLDRDGTVTRYVGYVTRPDQVQLIDGAAVAICRLRAAGFLCVLVTNQSAVGRGMITVDQLLRIHQELQQQLQDSGAGLDGIYFSTQLPCGHDETVMEHPERKPGPGMLQRAARDLNIDLRRSWMVGDRVSDVLAGINGGCRSIRVRTGYTYASGVPVPDCSYETVDSLQDAAIDILNADDWPPGNSFL